MAKMLKKLQSKTVPPKEERQQRPPGKDYVLLILMAMSVILVIAAWDTLDTLTITMYILLTLSLGLTYTPCGRSPHRDTDDARHARQHGHHRHRRCTVPARCLLSLHRIVAYKSPDPHWAGAFSIHLMRLVRLAREIVPACSSCIS